MNVADPIVIDIRQNSSVRSVFIKEHNFKELIFIPLNKILKMSKDELVD